MSPLPLLPFVTPQSITMCWGPSGEGIVTRKKSPNPMRYIRTRNVSGPVALVFFELFFVGFVFFGATSEPSVREGEIDREAVRIAPLDQTEPFVVASLALLARIADRTVQVLPDHVADLSTRYELSGLEKLSAPFGRRGPRDDDRRAAAHRKRAERGLVGLERFVVFLNGFDHQLGPERAVLPNPKDRMERDDVNRE